MRQKRIFTPTKGIDDWRLLLANPERHWRDGYSAKCVAERWEQSDTLPPEIVTPFSQCGFSSPELLMAIPEFRTELPGGGAASQSDVFAIIRTAVGVFAVAIEAKVAEPFGETVGEWLQNASTGKVRRLKFLCELLGVAYPPRNELRYQLFHRCGAALVEAERFGFFGAAMIVHSFSPQKDWIDDFVAFSHALGSPAAGANTILVKTPSSRPLLVGWAQG